MYPEPARVRFPVSPRCSDNKAAAKRLISSGRSGRESLFFLQQRKRVGVWSMGLGLFSSFRNFNVLVCTDEILSKLP